jgi:GNAT superfamily N-acetyltransferase
MRLVVDTIRERVVGGEDRELPLEAPLAELGFDSFALLTVVTGLEAAVGRGFPEEYWEHRPALRIRDLVEAVERFGEPVDRSVAEPDRSSMLATAAARVLWRAYNRLDVVLLDRKLDDSLPTLVPPPGVVLRRATPADDGSLVELWPRSRRRGAVRRLRTWRGQGYVALGAFEDGRAVALDWLHHSDPEGAVVAADPATCLGIDLRLRRGHENRGIGLALLAYSLEVAREEGYLRQAAYVARENHPMRMACTALLGFAEIGTARRDTLFGRAHWTWIRNGLTTSASVMPL